MAAEGELVSIDALMMLTAKFLSDAELKGLLRDLGRARARLDAAEAEALAVFDHRCAYVADGAVTAKAWLSHHTGVARNVAGSRVLLAKRLWRMPAMADALAAGTVTEQHARAMGRCLTPRTAAALSRDMEWFVDQAVALEADDFDMVVTRWLLVDDLDGPEPGGGRASELRVSRHFEGRVQVDGDLDVEDGAEFMAELDAIYEELRRRDQAAPDGDQLKARSHAQRNAEAAVEMARRSSAVRTGDEDEGPQARRPQLIVTVDLASLTGDPAGAGRLEDGTIVPRSILDRWACDCTVGRVVMAGQSAVIDLGRLSRTPSAAQRRALIARDHRCIVPGCGRKARWCDAHHVRPWQDGGPTDLSNLVLLCRRHHKQVHQEIIGIRSAGDGWEVTRADGTPLYVRPPPARVA